MHYSRLAAECLPHVLFGIMVLILLYFAPSLMKGRSTEVLIDIVSLYIPGIMAFVALQGRKVRTSWPHLFSFLWSWCRGTVGLVFL